MVSHLLRLDPFFSIYNICSRIWKHPKTLIVQLPRWKEILGDQTGTVTSSISWRLEQEFWLWKLFRKCFPFSFINLVPCDQALEISSSHSGVSQREKPGLGPDPLPPLAATTQTREVYENIEWKNWRDGKKFRSKIQNNEIYQQIERIIINY